MENPKVLTKDEKLSLAMKIQGQIDLAGAEKSDIYDVLIILAQLTFSDRAVNLSIGNYVLLT
jgi:hypothetical protein